MEPIRLKKPVTIGEGEAARTFTEIDLSKLDSLTGADIEFCHRQATAEKGGVVIALALDMDVHVQVASKASGVPVAVIRKMAARDYVEVVTTVQNFLTSSD